MIAEILESLILDATCSWGSQGLLFGFLASLVKKFKNKLRRKQKKKENHGIFRQPYDRQATTWEGRQLQRKSEEAHVFQNNMPKLWISNKMKRIKKRDREEEKEERKAVFFYRKKTEHRRTSRPWLCKWLSRGWLSRKTNKQTKWEENYLIKRIIIPPIPSAWMLNQPF